ncbi:SKI family transcriptional corepressor 1 [Gossypium arboreum]|uniref:SKI family transcriptional corepressor 1 n=1 Tax=Gossypium arboreum TaxID=29729 RepID=A0A0B0MNK5_GOSAR|nr:SKI family transcriptional corepressor 1 [Gossypium arboreum]
MAVEARHLNIFSSQFITNSHSRVFIKSNQGIGEIYNTQMDSCVPLIDSNSMHEVSAPGKRSRDSFTNGFDSYSLPQNNNLSGASSDVDDDVFSQIQQQHDIDRFISDHTEKMRLEVEERRKRQSRMLITAIQESVMKKLKEKDEEIQRIGKLNWVLQERVKSLYVENQLWRDLAQTNEATANSLRNNLEQVLAHAGDSGRGGARTCSRQQSRTSPGTCGRQRERRCRFGR